MRHSVMYSPTLLPVSSLNLAAVYARLLPICAATSGTVPLGRRATVRYKLLLSFTVCGLITALSLLPRFWVSIRDYGLGTWMAPVYSISEYYNAPEIPLFLMVAIQTFFDWPR